MKERAAIRKFLQKNPAAARILQVMIEEGKITTMDNPALDADALLTIVCSDTNPDIDGSVRDLCACGRGIWISPSTQTVMAQRGQSPLRIICPLCWIKELIENA